MDNLVINLSGQAERLMARFKAGWRGPAFECADIGVGDSSFKRLVHTWRRRFGADFILDEWSDNKVFTGRHKMYWLNPRHLNNNICGYEQLELFSK